MMWTDGLIRLSPAWQLYIGNHTVPAAVAVALLMGFVFTLLIVYPSIEKKLTGDKLTTICCSVPETPWRAPPSAPWRFRCTSC